MNLFSLCLILHIACLQACKTDFPHSTPVNKAQKQITRYHDRAVFTINPLKVVHDLQNTCNWYCLRGDVSLLQIIFTGSWLETSAVSQRYRSLRVRAIMSDDWRKFWFSKWRFKSSKSRLIWLNLKMCQMGFFRYNTLTLKDIVHAESEGNQNTAGEYIPMPRQHSLKNCSF